MRINVFNRLWISIFLISMSLITSCANLTVSGQTGVSPAQVQKLNERMRGGQYREIYQNGALSLQREISEDLFVARMNEAVGKMKLVDEDLSFQKSELADLSKSLDSEFWSNNVQKVDKNGRNAKILTQWVKEDGSFKLRSISIIELTGTGKYSIYYVEQEKVLTE